LAGGEIGLADGLKAKAKRVKTSLFCLYGYVGGSHPQAALEAATRAPRDWISAPSKAGFRQTDAGYSTSISRE